MSPASACPWGTGNRSTLSESPPASLSQWEIGDTVFELFGLAVCQQQFQVVSQAAEADALLRCKDDARKRTSLTLPVRDDPQEVSILREQEPSEFRGSREKVFVVLRGGTVVLTGEDVQAPPPQGLGHSHRYVHVHVQGECHLQDPRVSLRFRSSDREKV